MRRRRAPGRGGESRCGLYFLSAENASVLVQWADIVETEATPIEQREGFVIAGGDLVERVLTN